MRIGVGLGLTKARGAGSASPTFTLSGGGTVAVPTGSGAGLTFTAGYATPPTFQTITTAHFATTISKPTGVVDGDLLVLIWFTGSGSAITSTGFTQRLNCPIANGGNHQGQILTRIASSEGSTYTVSQNGYGAMFRISGHDAATPYDTGGQVNGTGTAVTVPGFTTTRANTLLVGASMSGNGTPGLFTGFTSQATTSAVRAATKTQTASGATGDITATNGSGTYASLICSINPAA